MRRIIVFLYGTIAYAAFLGTFLHAIGFVGDVAVSKSIDSGAEHALWTALLNNLLWLGLFAIPHSVMAREGFKKWWTKAVPQPVERSTYVLITCVLLEILFWQWIPMRDVVWAIENPIGRAMVHVLFWFGWILVVLATFMIDHFDLFGLRHVFLYLRGKEYTSLGFKAPALYRHLRHPILLGFIVAFWAAPSMTVGHLIFAIAATGYMFIGIQLEERDLVKIFGETYREYQQRVPMFLPLLRKK